MNNLVLIILLSILLVPAPWGIALNYETKECAGYWGGDEHKGYPLPSGWTAYYPTERNLIRTEIGACTWDYSDYQTREKRCCQELGYTYIAKNIGEKNSILAPISLYQIAIIICAGLLVCLVITLGVLGLTGLIRGDSFRVWKRAKKR